MAHLDETDIDFIPCGGTSEVIHFYKMYNTFNRYADFLVLFDRDKAGLKARAELISSGADENKLFLIPTSNHKSNPEIEDIVDKVVWDKCLKKLDSAGLVSLKTKKGDIVGYDFEPNDRVAVKKRFIKYLLSDAKNNLAHFSKYLELLKNINACISRLST